MEVASESLDIFWSSQLGGGKYLHHVGACILGGQDLSRGCRIGDDHRAIAVCKLN